MSNATITSRTELKHLRMPKEIVRWVERTQRQGQDFTKRVVEVLDDARAACEPAVPGGIPSAPAREP
jgi:hypothetical protein